MTNKLILLDLEGNPGAYLSKDKYHRKDWKPKDVARMYKKGMYSGFDLLGGMFYLAVPVQNILLASIAEETDEDEDIASSDEKDVTERNVMYG